MSDGVLNLTLEQFGNRVRKGVRRRGGAPLSATDQEDVVVDALDDPSRTVLLEVDQVDGKWPRMGWVAYALAELVRQGLVTEVVADTRRTWTIAAPPQNLKEGDGDGT